MVIADAAEDLTDVAPDRLVAPELHVQALFAARQHLLHDLGADDRMALHRGKFLIGQTARSQQHRVGDADLADIVDRGRDLGLALLLGAEIHDPCEIGAHLRHAAGVLAAVAVLGLERKDDAGKRGVEEVEQKVKIILFVKTQHIAEHVFQIHQRTEGRLAQGTEQLFIQRVELLVESAQMLPELQGEIQDKIQQQKAAEQADRPDRGGDARGKNADHQHLVHGGKGQTKGQLRAVSAALRPGCIAVLYRVQLQQDPKQQRHKAGKGRRINKQRDRQRDRGAAHQQCDASAICAAAEIADHHRQSQKEHSRCRQLDEQREKTLRHDQHQQRGSDGKDSKQQKIRTSIKLQVFVLS